jgi:hypothetical protein
MVNVVIALAGFAAATPAVGQVLIQYPPVEMHKLESKAVGDVFEIRVLLPPMIPGEQTRFPVLYMTDVNGEFWLADLLKAMMSNEAVPRFIAVGIGYPGAAGLSQALAMRQRDLTPVAAEGYVGLSGSPIAGIRKPNIASGGGPRFLDFIRDELIPFIDARYPTNPKDRGFGGDSYGGLFGSYVLFTKPDTFNRYIFGSPSIWWANGYVRKLAEQYVKTHDELAVTLYLGVGGLESTEIQMNVLNLERLLRSKKFPGLQLTTYVFPDETHITVAYMNLIRGVVSVYGPPAPGDGLMDSSSISHRAVSGPQSRLMVESGFQQLINVCELMSQNP